MSDPTNQRADGCSVFFTLLILVVLLGLFYSAQKFFEPESPSPVTEAIDQARTSKVNTYREASAQFTSSVVQYHKEKKYYFGIFHEQNSFLLQGTFGCPRKTIQITSHVY